MIRTADLASRLVGIYFEPPFSQADIAGFFQSLRGVFAARRSLVFCSDLRQVSIFPPEISDRLVEMMRADNPFVERNAAIISSSSIFGLQVERMLREAANPARRSFRDTSSALKWLGETLDADELDAARGFLARGG